MYINIRKAAFEGRFNQNKLQMFVWYVYLGNFH